MSKTFTLNTRAYTARGWVGNLQLWAYSAAGALLGQSTLSNSVVETNKGASFLDKWKLKVPTVAEADSSCACEGSVLRTVTLDLALSGERTTTTAERQQVLDQLDDLIADADFRAAFVAVAAIP